MNQAIEVGPLTLAYDRLLAVLFIWLFLALAARWGRGAERQGMEAAAWWALGVGIVAARLGYVAQNSAAFGAQPWTIFAVWQGGFSVGWGVAVAAAAVIFIGRRRAIVGPLLLLLGALSFGQYVVHNLVAPPPRDFPNTLIFMDMAGQPVPIERMRGQAFVVNLWASWCGPCRREMPMMKDVASKSSVPILFVNQGEDVGRVAAYLRAENMGDHHMLLDPFSQLGAVLGTQALPTTLFVSPDGQIISQHIGEISRAALMQGMEKAATHQADGRNMAVDAR
ncbi:TlpA disulfide reductase family protein [Sphingopyxis yananensis]|uniref:TlpA disulfide reductase family protein n=1 Tax=Sphingopyxis yananensis TaxID=2886687 RepID=UPI001D113152|nr:TlpA disulfide reductase family protein [Sphingopyxis yananensis]MCC2603607.1 TlpA family protein disulfide reductase [Sphingopyxis yananensis]